MKIAIIALGDGDSSKDGVPPNVELETPRVPAIGEHVELMDAGVSMMFVVVGVAWATGDQATHVADVYVRRDCTPTELIQRLRS